MILRAISERSGALGKLVGLALVSSALAGIYAAALYRYAAEEETGTFFRADMVQGAFQRR